MERWFDLRLVARGTWLALLACALCGAVAGWRLAPRKTPRVTYILRVFDPNGRELFDARLDGEPGPATGKELTCPLGTRRTLQLRWNRRRYTRTIRWETPTRDLSRLRRQVEVQLTRPRISPRLAGKVAALARHNDEHKAHRLIVLERGD